MNLIESYRNGQIYQLPNGNYSPSYLCRSGGSSYQAQASGGRELTTLEAAHSAIDEAESQQERTLSKFDCQTYVEAKQRGIGTRWPKPAFWPPYYDEVLTVVHVGRSYILSTHNGQTYLSMGNADCQYACPANPGDIERFVRSFESPVTVSNSCHYCGMAATSIGFFGEQVCRECGGK